MRYNEDWRMIAKAARLRDWAAIDAVLADKAACGSENVIRGFNDARKVLGQEPPLPALAEPAPLTIHDVDPAKYDIVDRYEGSGGFIRPKRAA